MLHDLMLGSKICNFKCSQEYLLVYQRRDSLRLSNVSMQLCFSFCLVYWEMAGNSDQKRIKNYWRSRDHHSRCTWKRLDWLIRLGNHAKAFQSHQSLMPFSLLYSYISCSGHNVHPSVVTSVVFTDLPPDAVLYSKSVTDLVLFRFQSFISLRSNSADYSAGCIMNGKTRRSW